MQRAKEEGKKLLLPSDTLKSYKQDRKKLDDLIRKFAKENVHFDTATRKDAKTGEEFIATIFQDGNRDINKMPASSVYEYKYQ